MAAPLRSHRCPDCGGTAVDRDTERRAIDALLRLIRRRRYVCRDCGREFIDRRLRGRS